MKAVSCLGATHIGRRWDENGRPYDCTADDAAYATFELEGGILAHINASWCVRVRRDDLLVLQVDGTKGSAVAGPARLLGAALRRHAAADLEPRRGQPVKLFRQLATPAGTAGIRQRLQGPVGAVPAARASRTSRSAGRCLEGAKGVQLAEKGIESWQKRQWVDVPDLEA